MAFLTGMFAAKTSVSPTNLISRHYFYVLRGEYLVPMTPRGGWFGRSTKLVPADEGHVRPGVNYNKSTVGKKARRKMILSQSMVIDIDPNRVCAKAMLLRKRANEGLFIRKVTRPKASSYTTTSFTTQRPVSTLSCNG